MKIPVIDKTKLPEVMEIIEHANFLMTEKDCDEEDVKNELEGLQNQLREITGKPQIEIESFKRYDAVADLETISRDALMASPEKEDLTDEQVKDIVLNIFKHNEIEQSWCLNFLKLNTGLENVTDYFFYPTLVGLDENSSLEQIADKINADKNNANRK